MSQDKIQLLRELGFNLTPPTLAAIVADLNCNECDQFSHNMSLALDIMIEAGEAKAGSDFALMVIEAEADR